MENTEIDTTLRSKKKVCLAYFWVDLRERCSRNKTWKSYWYLHLIFWKSLSRSSTRVHFFLNQTSINDVFDDSDKSFKPPWIDKDLTVPGLRIQLRCDIINIPNWECSHRSGLSWRVNTDFLFCNFNQTLWWVS